MSSQYGREGGQGGGGRRTPIPTSSAAAGAAGLLAAARGDASARRRRAAGSSRARASCTVARVPGDAAGATVSRSSLPSAPSIMRRTSAALRPSRDTPSISTTSSCGAICAQSPAGVRRGARGAPRGATSPPRATRRRETEGWRECTVGKRVGATVGGGGGRRAGASADRGDGRRDAGGCVGSEVRRVRLVRKEGRDVSALYGREGGVAGAYRAGERRGAARDKRHDGEGWVVGEAQPDANLLRGGDAACPLSTRGGTRLVRLVRGRGGGGANLLRGGVRRGGHGLLARERVVVVVRVRRPPRQRHLVRDLVWRAQPQRDLGPCARGTCPISTEGWTRRVHFVREGGGGGGVSPRARGRHKKAQPPSTACASRHAWGADGPA